MKVLNIDEFVSEKLDIKPVTKDRLGRIKDEINNPKLFIKSVNYVKVWSVEGTAYNQTICVKMTESELFKLNKKLNEIAYSREKFEKTKLPLGKQMYLQAKIPLQKGDNFLNQTTFAVLCMVCNLYENKRILQDRNTRLVIEL